MVVIYSVINQKVIFATAYYRNYMLKIPILKMNISRSIMIDSLKIESHIDNILNDVSSISQRKRKKINLCYNYLN